MESNLRPLTLGEILDRTAQLYRTNFLLFAGISSVYAGVILVLSLFHIGVDELLRIEHMLRYRVLFDIAWLYIIFLPLNFVFYGAVTAAISRTVAWVHLDEPATIRGAYSSILRRLGRYMWLKVIMGFFIWAPFFVFVIIAAVLVALIPGIAPGKANPADPQTMALLGVFFLVLLLFMIPGIVYVILMAIRYSLSVPACVVEDLKARKAIRRSIELAKGSWGRIFLLGLLVLVIQIGLVAITRGPFSIMAFKQPGFRLPAWIQVIQQILGFFTNTFLGPIWAIGITLFYYDQRIRKEGYDIEWMMQAAGLTPPPPAELPAATNPPQPAPQNQEATI
jgi:hypothetical protein